MSKEESAEEDRQVEMWKVKKLIKSLQAARGYVTLTCFVTIDLPLNCFLISSNRNGTSMISLITPPKDQVSRINKMLADEYGTASNIKSRVNRCACSVVLFFIANFNNRAYLYLILQTVCVGCYYLHTAEAEVVYQNSR